MSVLFVVCVCVCVYIYIYTYTHMFYCKLNCIRSMRIKGLSIVSSKQLNDNLVL
jgi:hypothetical protein